MKSNIYLPKYLKEKFYNLYMEEINEEKNWLTNIGKQLIKSVEISIGGISCGKKVYCKECDEYHNSEIIFVKIVKNVIIVIELVLKHQYGKNFLKKLILIKKINNYV